MEDRKYAWAIAYIDRDNLARFEKDLHKHGYGDCKVIVPSVKVLKKKFKNKEYFDEVPLLFNYGFVKLPMNIVNSKDALQEFKQKIPGIYSWLYDNSKRDTKNEEGEVTMVPKVYLAKFTQIARLINVAKCYSVYDVSDIKTLKIGEVITLKGYPFDNLPAEFLGLSDAKKTVKVRISFGNITRDVLVDYSNVFYSIYTDYDEEKLLTDVTLEGIHNVSKTKVDKIYSKNYENEQ